MPVPLLVTTTAKRNKQLHYNNQLNDILMDSMNRRKDLLDLEILEILKTRGTLRLDALRKKYEARYGHYLDF